MAASTLTMVIGRPSPRPSILPRVSATSLGRSPSLPLEGSAFFGRYPVLLALHALVLQPLARSAVTDGALTALRVWSLWCACVQLLRSISCFVAV